MTPADNKRFSLLRLTRAGAALLEGLVPFVHALRGRIDGLALLVGQFIDLRVIDHQRRRHDQATVRRSHDRPKFEADRAAMPGQLGFVAKALARLLVPGKLDPSDRTRALDLAPRDGASQRVTTRSTVDSRSRKIGTELPDQRSALLRRLRHKVCRYVLHFLASTLRTKGAGTDMLGEMLGMLELLPALFTAILVSWHRASPGKCSGRCRARGMRCFVEVAAEPGLFMGTIAERLALRMAAST